jgi:hypothetical protein
VGVGLYLSKHFEWAEWFVMDAKLSSCWLIVKMEDSYLSAQHGIKALIFAKDYGYYFCH